MSVKTTPVTHHLKSVKKAVVKNTDSEPLENRLSAENAGTSESLELLSCPHESDVTSEISPLTGNASADNNSDLLLKFSASPSLLSIVVTLLLKCLLPLFIHFA